MRLAADWRQVRRAHVSVHRSKELDSAHGTRGFDLKNRRRPALLPAAARVEDGRCRLDDRERFLQAGLSRVAHGICRRSAEAAEREPGRKRWVIAKVRLQIAEVKIA